MTLGEVRAATGNREPLIPLIVNEFGRTSMVAAQMVGDGVIMTSLSYLSFILVRYTHDDGVLIQFFPYAISTFGTTMIMIAISVRSGVYDVFNEFHRYEIVRSTLKSIALVILILTAALFIVKVSDTLS